MGTENGVSKPAVACVVETLSKEILARNEHGWYIGLEGELQSRLGVSKPTLRQALRVLESHGLVEVRRGINGGLYGRIPGQEAVVRTASVYLDSRGATGRDILLAQEAIFVAVVHAAVKNPARCSMRDWFAVRDAEGEYTPRRALETSLEAMNRLAELTDNHVLILFERVLFKLSSESYDIGIFRDPSRMLAVLEYLRSLSRAIAIGDQDLAVNIVRQNTAMIGHWVDEYEKTIAESSDGLSTAERSRKSRGRVARDSDVGIV